jgi:KDO2-lipid IV(A) lauroyltransferase
MLAPMRAVLGLLTVGGLFLADLVLRSLPLRAALGVADVAGAVWFALDGRRRRRARESLRVAGFGGSAAGERDLLRGTFRSLMRVPVEVFLFPRHFRRAEDVQRRCRLVGDWERLLEDMLRGRGGIVMGGHLGNWELAAWSLRFLPVLTRVVVRPLANPWIDRRATRGRGGEAGVIRKHGAVREMLRTLRRGDWLAILGDQDAGASGGFVPFFGLPASTHAAPFKVAARTGVPVYVGACVRRDRPPFTFDLLARRVPDPDPGLPEAARAEQLSREVGACLEAWIRGAPEQYNWIHRRWKTRPPGEVWSAAIPSYARSVPVSPLQEAGQGGR